MAITYPREPLQFRVRVALGADLTARPGTWVWTDITEDVSFSKARAFPISAGALDEQQQSDSSLQFVIRNHESAYFDGAGRYTGDNPNSDLWPHFDVGLPVEFSVDPGDGTWHVLAIQFLGEAVNSWPGGSRHLVLTTCTWGGLLRRLQRYHTPQSPLYRTLSTARPDWQLMHYWPIEQGTPGLVRQGVWPAAGPNAAITPALTSSPTFAGTETPPISSLPLPLWKGNDRLRFSPTNDGNFGNNNGTHARWEYGFAFRGTVAQTGTVAPTFWTAAEANRGSYKSGVDATLQPVPAFTLSFAAQFKEGVYTPGSGAITLKGNDNGSNVTTVTTTDVNLFDGEWVFVRVIGESNASILTGNPLPSVFVMIDKPSLPNVLQLSFTGADNTFMPKPTAVTIGSAYPNLAVTVAGTTPDNNTAALEFSSGHAYYRDETTGRPDFVLTSFDGTGELALVRVARLCAEELVPFSPYAVSALAATMGPYGVADLVTLLRECELADHGVLVDRLAVVTLVGSAYMVNRASSLTIDGAATHGALGNRGQLRQDITATIDDLHLVNAVTASRTAGGSATAVAPESISLAGRYDSQPSINSKDLRSIRGQAGWVLRLGQAKGSRYATLTANLRENPELIPTVLAMLEAQPRTGYDPADLDSVSGIGLRISIANPPTGSAPGQVELQVRGWAMLLVGRQGGWTITFNLVPYWPWEVFVIESGSGNRSRLATGREPTTGATNSELAVATNTSTTDMVVLHKAGTFTWSGDDVPFDLLVDGEPVTASAVTSYLTDTFARTVAAGSWGTPTVGAAYTLVGTAGDFSVGSNRGVIAPTTNASDRMAVIAGPASPGVVYGEFRATALPANTTGYRMGVVLRRQVAGSGGNHDNFTCELLVSGSTTVPTVTARITARVGATLNVITANLTGWTYVANTWYSVLGYVVGDTAYCRVWPTFDAAGVVRVHRLGNWNGGRLSPLDPAGVGVQDYVPDSADAVQFGAFARTDDGTTNKVFHVANLQLLTPQRFTVARSISGVVRAHAVGSEVELYRPAARSLGSMLEDL